MATSYANPGGTGNRTGIIGISTNTVRPGGSGPVSALIDGSFANSFYFSSVSNVGGYVRFDFGLNGEKLIDEFKWYQDNGTTHGTWAFQGSNDASAWTTLATFTLGGTLQTVSFANANYYRYYQLIGVSGSSSNGPYDREIEFKLEAAPTVSASRVSQFAVISIQESVPAPIDVSQFSAISIQQSYPQPSLISQFAMISVIANGRKTVSLGNPIGLDCWQPCTAYGTTGLIVYLGG